MEESKQHQEVINLGKKLVQEFSEAGRRDRTLQWMAHYLAELMTKAEQETSESQKMEVQKECVKTILMIWEKRANFPHHTRPLDNISEMVPIIEALQRRHTSLSLEVYIAEQNEKPLSKFIKSIWNATEEMIKVGLVASVIPENLTKERDWLAHLNHLSKEERKLFEYLDETLLQKSQFAAIINKIADRNDNKRLKMEDIIPLLEESIALQSKSLETLISSLQSSTSDNSHQSIEDSD